MERWVREKCVAPTGHFGIITCECGKYQWMRHTSAL